MTPRSSSIPWLPPRRTHLTPASKSPFFNPMPQSPPSMTPSLFSTT
uniref:Pentatricopeptide repeat-containing protein At2g17670 family n=1 Tax=Rhizophora mucronata TaxID=61149 RepID=A0A2P2NZY6_RHIMU